ncbi:MAG: hypothetical protein M1838_006022 [Thelocarpon superellum]|nr:MAG: hypothetical protein M1838_006022 [Thelocarpon superellum]
MDIDMDVDLGLGDEEILVDEAEATGNNVSVLPLVEPIDPANGTASSSDADHPTPHKVHLRGLDNLHTSDINLFAAEHFPSADIVRIEWIDDHSANIVYDTPGTAMRALKSFSLVSSIDLISMPTVQLRPAQRLSTHPDAPLQARIAVIGDRKQPGARERSRYYLFNPDQDPAEKRSRGSGGRRGSSRYHDDNSNYRRRPYDDREHRRRRDEDEDDGFNAALYDDDSAALAARERPKARRRSDSDASSESLRRTGKGKELFPNRGNGRGRVHFRDRSASPLREKDSDGDRDMVTDGDKAYDRLARRRGRERSYSPRPSRRRDRDWTPEVNQSKELFPYKSTTTEMMMDHEPSSTGSGKELFPQKQLRNHRRSGAFDAADETADLFAGRMSVPFTDGSLDQRGTSKRLADRISRASTTPLGSHQVVLPDVEPANDEVGGFSIRGSAKQVDSGFSIRGAAAAAGGGVLMLNGRELFPGKQAPNSGKELFTEKLSGRGTRRRKAEDMFY